MYIRQYGLEKNPFKNAPGSTLFYTSFNHKGILDSLVEGIRGRYGLHLVTGENGTGKTTLARFIQMAYGHEFTMAYLGNPFVTDTEFLNHILEAFGGVPQPAASPKQIVDALTRLLDTQGSHSDRVTVLLVDEAHHLAPGIFDHLLVLANLHHAGVPRLQMVLFGLSSLLDVLSDPRLCSLNQRIGSRSLVSPMGREETGKYIGYRLTKAGCRKQYLFDKGAVKQIFKTSRGIPRLINHLSSLALEEGARQTQSTINAKVVRAVLKNPAYSGLFFPTQHLPAGITQKARKKWLAVAAGLLITIILGVGGYLAADLFLLAASSPVSSLSQANQRTMPSNSEQMPAKRAQIEPTYTLSLPDVPEIRMTEPRLEIPSRFPVTTGRSEAPTTVKRPVAEKPAEEAPTAELAVVASPLKKNISATTSSTPSKVDSALKQETEGVRSVAETKEKKIQTTASQPQRQKAIPAEPLLISEETHSAPFEQSEQASTKVPTPTATQAEVPQLPDLPYLPAKFADVRLNALVWDQAPEKRIAVINSQILHEKSMYGRLTVLNIGKGYVILGNANQRYLLEPNTR